MYDLCLDFINSSWYATHKNYKEILMDPELLMDFFKKRGFSIDISPDQEAMNSLLELRFLLTKSFEASSDNKPIPNASIKKINAYLSSSPCIREAYQVDGKYKLKLQPIKKDWSWILSEISASFVELLYNGDISRVKVCPNPDCNWFFYDETKSHTKRWCGETCASLMKVRKFRAKQKASQSK